MAQTLTHTLKSTLKAFAADERGNSALEYCVILTFIGGTLVVALPAIGSGFEAKASTISTALYSPAPVSSPVVGSSGTGKTCNKSGGGSSSRTSGRSSR